MSYTSEAQVVGSWRSASAYRNAQQDSASTELVNACKSLRLHGNGHEGRFAPPSSPSDGFSDYSSIDSDWTSGQSRSTTDGSYFQYSHLGWRSPVQTEGNRLHQETALGHGYLTRPFSWPQAGLGSSLTRSGSDETLQNSTWKQFGSWRHTNRDSLSASPTYAGCHTPTRSQHAADLAYMPIAGSQAITFIRQPSLSAGFIDLKQYKRGDVAFLPHGLDDGLSHLPVRALGHAVMLQDIDKTSRQVNVLVITSFGNTGECPDKPIIPGKQCYMPIHPASPQVDDGKSLFEGVTLRYKTCTHDKSRCWRYTCRDKSGNNSVPREKAGWIGIHQVFQIEARFLTPLEPAAESIDAESLQMITKNMDPAKAKFFIHPRAAQFNGSCGISADLEKLRSRANVSAPSSDRRSGYPCSLGPTPSRKRREDVKGPDGDSK